MWCLGAAECQGKDHDALYYVPICSDPHKDINVQDKRIPACPVSPHSSHRAPSYIRSRFGRVPTPDAKERECLLYDSHQYYL